MATLDFAAAFICQPQSWQTLQAHFARRAFTQIGSDSCPLRPPLDSPSFTASPSKTRPACSTLGARRSIKLKSSVGSRSDAHDAPHITSTQTRNPFIISASNYLNYSMSAAIISLTHYRSLPNRPRDRAIASASEGASKMSSKRCPRTFLRFYSAIAATPLMTGLPRYRSRARKLGAEVRLRFTEHAVTVFLLRELE